METCLLRLPFCKPSHPPPQAHLVSITWKERWGEMGADQLTAQGRRWASQHMRTLSIAVQGVCSRMVGGGGCGTCALLTYCRSSFPAGRGLPSACALFLQHCRGYFAAALVWHLPESSRAGLGWAGLGGEGGAGAGGIVRSFVLSFSAPAPPSAGAHNPQVFFFFPVTAPTGCNRNRAA
jgi:hypothetical protein